MLSAAITAATVAVAIAAPPHTAEHVVYHAVHKHESLDDTFIVCGMLDSGYFFVVMAVDNGKEARLLYKNTAVSQRATKLCTGPIVHESKAP